MIKKSVGPYFAAVAVAVAALGFAATLWVAAPSKAEDLRNGAEHFRAVVCDNRESGKAFTDTVARAKEYARTDPAGAAALGITVAAGDGFAIRCG